MNAYLNRLPLAIAMASALVLTAGCNQRAANDRNTTQTTPATGTNQADRTVTEADATYGANQNRDQADATRMGDGRDSSQPVDDTWITTKVKSSLLANTDVAGLDIEVNTLNGVVTLSGQVKEKAQIDHATRIARETEGVTSVQTDRLAVGTTTKR